MGRPREHDQRTALALLDAAERTIQEGGVEAVSVRSVAEAAGTTTRAVYSLFGSRDGLLDALGGRAFELLGSAIRALPRTEDPAADLAEAGVTVFRRFVTEHPILFRIGFGPGHGRAASLEAARLEALAGLMTRIRRLDQAGQLGGRTVDDAVIAFHAMCEGLAGIELRGMMSPGQQERIWRDALTALVAGLAHSPQAAK